MFVDEEQPEVRVEPGQAQHGAHVLGCTRIGEEIQPDPYETVHIGDEDDISYLPYHETVAAFV